MSRNRNEGESGFLLPIHIMPRVMLFLLTVVCFASMGYYYLRKENVVSVGQAAGLVFVPFQKGINALGGAVFQAETDRLTLEEANEKVARLEQENASMAALIEEQNRMVYDYRDLQNLLELKNTYSDYPTVSANVVFRDASSNWYSSFTIDVGSEDGIREGMNVLADGGLVGYVSDTSSHHSTVSTIINDSVNVTGVQLSTGDSCIAIGDLTMMKQTGRIRLDYMNADFSISNDATIVTSRISDRYLPNIVIGYAADISINEDKLTSSGYLRPAVDFEHISRVLVITRLKEASD